VYYRGQLLSHQRIDLLVSRRLVVEVKAVQAFAPIHEAQVISYLRAAKLRVALLVNFNVNVLRKD